MADFTLCLAYATATNAWQSLQQWDWEGKPMGVLFSFFYLNRIHGERMSNINSHFKMLDSGAFSAYNSGKVIDIDALTNEAISGPWDEAVALDVIGDPDVSLQNALYMKDKGAPVYPVFHIGEPWGILKQYCENFEKVGLSCRFGESPTESMRWLKECFARQWPHRFHSFGYVSDKMLMALPFETADTASWERAPNEWGRWKMFPGDFNIRDAKNLLYQMEWYYRLQEKVRARWYRTLKNL